MNVDAEYTNNSIQNKLLCIPDEYKVVKKYNFLVVI